MESNGTHPAPPGLDWLCISPKSGHPLVQRAGSELKVVVPQEGQDPLDAAIAAGITPSPELVAAQGVSTAMKPALAALLAVGALLLIAALLGREVPSGGLPLDVHALCVNVATTAEIGRLLPHGRGIQERLKHDRRVLDKGV